MNYSECRDYLYRLGNEVLTMKFGLESIRTLLEALGNPHRDYPSILIAGTNGKGSVARFLNSICISSGLKTALYTSPHLVNLEERMRVNGAPIDRTTFAECFTQVIETIRAIEMDPHPTFFETVTATAMLYFSRAGVEVAVLEIGMGGRLDSTNVVDPLVSVVTPVSYDHQQYLGSTLTEIAGEKAGIMRRGVPAISWQRFEEARSALRDAASRSGALLHELHPGSVQVGECVSGRYSFRYQGEWFQLGPPGGIQCRNGALAVEAARALQKAGLSVTDAGIRDGLERARTPGVLQFMEGRPTVLLDGAHNPDSIANLTEFIEVHTEPPRHLVFGMMKDKAIEPVLKALEGLFEKIFVARIDSPRSAGPEEIARVCPAVVPCPSAEAALQAARAGARTVVVTGSFFLVGEILEAHYRATPGVDCAPVLARDGD